MRLTYRNVITFPCINILVAFWAHATGLKSIALFNNDTLPIRCCIALSEAVPLSFMSLLLLGFLVPLHRTFHVLPYALAIGSRRSPPAVADCRAVRSSHFTSALEYRPESLSLPPSKQFFKTMFITQLQLYVSWFAAARWFCM